MRATHPIMLFPVPAALITRESGQIIKFFIILLM